MTSKQEKYLATVPSRYRRIISRALDGTATRSGVIKAKCLDCCHFEKEEVANCTVEICPNYAYRPYPQKPRKQARGSAYVNLAAKSGGPDTQNNPGGL